MSDILTEFLLARIAEDEAAAKAAQEEFTRFGGTPPTWGKRQWGFRLGVRRNPALVAYVVRHDPARVLADCEAKRCIVEDYRAADESWRERPEPENPKRLGKWYNDMTDADFERYEAWTMAVSLRDAVERLATPYADHPDYREEWRP